MNGMVTFKNVGRMGNFLFQAATSLAYAWDTKREFTVPTTTNSSKWNPIYLQHLANPNFNPRLPGLVIKEYTHGYQQLPYYPGHRGNVTLDGYWQSEKYFVKYRKQILDAFQLPWTPLPGVVSVHVRRTDYLELSEKHPPVPLQWYLSAMSQFGIYRFRVFSDDIAWCKENFKNRGYQVEFSEGQNEVQDLTDMSGCEHHICSASTFAWWGAWLNRSEAKRVVMPKHWFQPGYRKTDTKDIVPSTWERL